jgi:hypothetical protein
MQPLLPRRAFIARMAAFACTAAGLVAVALGMGMIGYRFLEGMSWTDSFLNASMILGGMGPVNGLQTEAGKIFAGGYALFSGLIFLVAVGIVFAPLFHRLLHRFHIEAGDAGKTGIPGPGIRG